MTEDGWKVFGELMEILKDRFDEQEKRIKHLEWQVDLLKKDKGWFLVQSKDLRDCS
jgi:hypothetical protein